MQTLADCGEDRVVAALLARLPASVRGGDEVIAGAGDDCAVVRPPADAGAVELLKTDCVIEGVHYTPDTLPERVGWKALCRPLSDIAAMGGQPRHALITLALSGSATLAYAQAIYTGLGRAAERFGVRIIGGETARAPAAAFISVALTGTASLARVISRSGGKPGHLVYVTGRLGGSFASGKHLDFMPRLPEAQWLVAGFPVSAMMDLSDGRGRVLPRLAAASGTGYAVDTDTLPLTPGCSVAQALDDGEDYELLFTIEPQSGEALERSWRERWPELELTRIGRLAPPTLQTGLPPGAGFDHFARATSAGTA